MSTNLATKTIEQETPERPMSRSFFEPATPAQELSDLTLALHEYAPLIGHVSMQLTSEVEGVSNCGIIAGTDDNQTKIWQIQARNGSSAGLLHGQVGSDSVEWRYLSIDNQGRTFDRGELEDPDCLLAGFVVNALYAAEATKTADELVHKKVESITECYKTRQAVGSFHGWLTRPVDIRSSKLHAHNARIGFLPSPLRHFSTEPQSQSRAKTVDDLPDYVQNLFSQSDHTFRLQILK